MNRRDVLSAALAGSVTAMSSPAVRATAPNDGDETLLALAQRLSREGLADTPQSATSQGLDIGANAILRHRLNDRSGAVQARDLARAKAAITAVEAVDPQTLSAPMALYREVFLYRQRALAIGPERFGVSSPQYPFVITHRDGAYLTVPDFLTTTHRIRNADDAEAYLDRVRAFAVALDQESRRQVDEAKRGYLAPAFVLDTALVQMAALRAPAGQDNVLTRSVIRRTTGTVAGDWGARCAAIVEGEVYPALDRQMAVVRRLRDGARTSAGVWDLPDGAALYTAALEDATTTKGNAEELHGLGLAQVADIGGQLEGPLAAQGLTRGSVGERLRQLSRRADLLYPDTAAGRAAVLRDAEGLTAGMRRHLSAVFRNPPDAPLRIEAASAEVEEGASDGNYFPASWDNSVPARLRLNLKALAASPKYTLPVLIYHEGVPGHHLQYNCGREGFGWSFTAYKEGWALYAEHLADELGAYATPLDRIGYLQSRLYRAARLVVDTGIHARRWNRERATDYLVTEAGLQPEMAKREVDRYCAQPGQACSYMVGYLAWIGARENVRRKLGAKYDVQSFHDVLRYGPVPLPIMERLVNERARAFI